MTTHPNDLARALYRAATALEAHGTTIDRTLTETAATGPAAARFDRVGSSGNDTSDPTGNAALRPATRRHAEQLDEWRGLLREGEAIATAIDRFLTNHNPDPDARPATWKPCGRSWAHYTIDRNPVNATVHTHRADLDGTRCETCGDSWPCREGEPGGWREECTGRISPLTNLCSKCRGEGPGWTCHRCDREHDAAVKRRRDPMGADASADWLCPACYQHQRRAAKEAAA